MHTTTWDVIVIGGGLAGTTAARLLAEQGQSVLLLEARDRLGGRSHTVTTADGHAVDVGGQWLSRQHQRVLALVDECDGQTYRQYNRGNKHLDLLGERSCYRSTIPKLPIRSLWRLQRGIARIEKLAKKINPTDPMASQFASKFDAITVSEWLQQHVTDPRVEHLINLSINAVYACEPQDLSMLHFLFYIRSAGSFMQLLDINGNGAQHLRVHGGIQPLVEWQGQRAQQHGATISINSPVVSINQDHKLATVITEHTDCRAKHQAHRVICTLPPTLAAGLNWQFELPAPRQQLQEQMPMGRVIKCIATYHDAFWRQQRFSGEIVTDQGPFQIAFDNSSADGEHAALVVFILGDAAKRWHGADPMVRQQAVLQRLANFFGSEALAVKAFIAHDWLDEIYSGGCYAGLMPPDLYTNGAAALRQPVGVIHWAGTETATEWNGYLEGAMQSAERVAEEIMKTTTSYNGGLEQIN